MTAGQADGPPDTRASGRPSGTPSSRAWARFSLAALVVLVPALLAASFRPPVDLGLDGAGYYHIAEHVARGHGLVTSVSLYHQGLHPLPQASTIYPVWPLLLGAFGSVFGPSRAGAFLPKLLYVLDVWLAYRVLERALRRACLPSGKRSFPPGAAAFGALLFALNPVLFWCASLPYSEALSLTFVFLVLLAVDRAANAGRDAAVARACAVAGFLSALLYLTRFQAILAPFAVAFVLFVAGERRHAIRRGLIALVSASVPVALEAWMLLRHPHATPSMLFDFASYRQLPELPEFNFVVRTSSSFEWFFDRMSGLFVAFDPREEDSYYASFGALAYAPFVAALVGALRPRATLARIDSAVRAPRYALVTGAVLLGAALVLPIHAAHEIHYRPWLFGFRHGLPFVLVGLFALFTLLGSRLAGIRIAGMVLGVSAGFHGAEGILHHVRSKPQSPSGLPDAAAFLGRHPGAMAITIDPQSLSVHTDAGLYWSACWTAPDVLPTLLDHVRVDYLLLRPHERSCPAFSRLSERLTLVESLASGRILAFSIRKTP